LVFTKTAGFHHESIPDGVKAIQKMGAEKGFIVDTTSDASRFTEDSLKQYSAVIFLSTTGDVLNNREQADFERYIEAGGGYVGVHAAADCEYQWPWYGKLVGAYFKSHPRQQKATLHIHKDKKFPVTDSLPDPWVRKDEWYNFRALPQDVHVLVSIDEKSYEGGSNGENHPMVWYHEYDGGRAFYMELGHTTESYTEPDFLKLLWAGIHYAIGKNEALNYDKATALRVPDEDRFSKKFLAGGLDEPTELTVLPKLDVLIAERKGDIKFYNAADNTITKAAHLDVYDKALHTKGVNVEMGLLGIQADPHYDKNHWIYVYYSPADKSVDRLSRFKFENNQFNIKTEQVILEVNTDREICCHTGGSIAFDANDNLYVSVGDNTTPFNEKDPVTGKTYDINLHGYAPLDDRPGFEHYDDRRAAGNTNDLRGKILRIHVNEDGSYSIPDGNLFPKGTPKTRPEIYVMGDRNPYRISVDKHTGYLYWGEVGPDAGNDSLETRGPRGYDEINQARKAGNFGWPYFVGNNYAYHQYNYATGESGPAFDPQHLVNNSRNNTGLKDLPPAQPAFIWYPYAVSPDFPILGKGGRCAMGGPVYYVNDYPAETRYPEYYNGKLFIYDWIRNWIMVVTMNQSGDLQTIEPFMPHTKFHNISDMEAGPDGRLYIIEYGEGWFAKNADAALSVITYNGGNRPPVVEMHVDQQSGALPLKITASADGTHDPDGDKLTYEWNFGNGSQVKTDTPGVEHVFNSPGIYPVSVTVSDNKGAESKSKIIHVYAGNSMPKVNIHVSGNPTFYFPDRPVNYQVTVNDQEDGHSDQPGFDQSRVLVQANYLESADKASLPAHDVDAMAAGLSGKSLMESLDCKSCHKIDEKSIGPAFKQVALRYKDDPRAMNFLPEKIIKGGSGNWGETAMAAHPDLSVADAGKIVSWILSLASDSGRQKSLPLKGAIIPSAKFKLTDQGAIVLSASYVDKGAKNVPSLTGAANIILLNPSLQSGSARSSSGISDKTVGDMQVKLINTDSGWIKFSHISLQEVNAVQIHYGLEQASDKGWSVSLHLDSPEGKLLGQTRMGTGITPMKPATANLKLSQPADDALHDVYFVFHRLDSHEKGGLGIIDMLLKAR
jgi:glucose/arabinose dehydrogenase/cytochrome c551/c552/type 1 glutamine amidotransferase